jgi:lysophospholipase L1-like esterase
MRFNFLLSVCASITGWLCLSTTAANLPVSRIAILGDSFSERGWPSLLQGDPTYPGGANFSNKLARILPSCVLSNFAVGGAHASGWLGIQTNAQGIYQGNGARMYLTNWPALLAFEPDLTVVYIGGNDFNEGPSVTIQTITDRVGLLIDRLREHNPQMQIVLGCYNDAYDGLSRQAVTKDRYTNASIAILRLKDSLEELAREKHCESVCQTIYDTFMNHCWGRDLGGPIHLEPTYSRSYVPSKADQHPSLAGHAELANIFYAKFAEMAGVSPAIPSRKFEVQSHYLNFPVKIGAPKRWVSLLVNGKVEQRFNLELAAGEPDWWAFLNVSPWKGQTVTVEAEGPEPATLAGIEPGDSIRGGENIYHEALRPQLHFSARRGRNNDPNGLCYYNGEYHLFLQLNPYGWSSGNKYWGHAASKDLVHWRELDHALTPDALGRMFSGSAAVDWKNTTGFGRAVG